MVPSSFMISQMTPAGRSPGQASEIHRSLGVACAYEHAAIASDKREDVAGAYNVAPILFRIDGDRDGLGPVIGGDAGRDAFLCLDRDGERRRMPRLVRARHALEMQRVRALGRHREADQAAPEAGHEIDGVGRRHLGRNDEVALVFALLGVHQDEHAALARVFEDVVDGRELLVDLRLVEDAQWFALHFNPTYWPNSLAT